MKTYNDYMNKNGHGEYKQITSKRATSLQQKYLQKQNREEIEDVKGFF